MSITNEERREWKNSPVTKAFVATLRKSKQEAMEAWAMESFVGHDAHNSAVQNATALGGVRVLNDIIDDIETLGDE